MLKRSLSTLALFSLLAGCASQDIDPDGYDKTGTASYYGSRHHGKRTASGEPFNQHGLTAAHRSLPFGSRVRVTNLANQRSVVVRINGPWPTHPRPPDRSFTCRRRKKSGMIRSGTRARASTRA
ncbi:rare lipoprotein A [Pseudomonas putida S11]|nr:rare lipoprotein A [Pseudomonas putida S11]